MKGCWACVASVEARPSRKKPPTGPSASENGGVKEAYMRDGALRKPVWSMFGPPSATGNPWSVAGSAVKARLGTWHVPQLCCPETDRLLSKKIALPATDAADGAGGGTVAA